VKLAEVRQLLGQSHLWIQPTLFGHIPDPPSRREIERHAIPAHLARIGGEHAEHDPHRRGLACPVAPHKPEKLAGANIETQVLQGDRLPVTFRDPFDLETSISAHVSSGATAARSPVEESIGSVLSDFPGAPF
jgi:hypothetical protein